MQNKISTVIIGGTYNPVHIGHMHLADEVMRKFNPERILIVPSYISAHKKGDEALLPEHRLRMLEIACRDSELIIETCELDRKGVSYTVDTVEYIKQKYNLTENPGLLIGDDLTGGFSSWKKVDKLLNEVRLIVAYRNNSIDPGFKYEHSRIDNLMLDISSSDIRRRIAAGEACRYLMPSGVYEYIISNGLYGDR